jgi:hypothetical protein
MNAMNTNLNIDAVNTEVRIRTATIDDAPTLAAAEIETAQTASRSSRRPEIVVATSLR